MSLSASESSSRERRFMVMGWGMSKHSYLPILVFGCLRPFICLLWMLLLGCEQGSDLGCVGFLAAGNSCNQWALWASRRSTGSSARGWFWICQWRCRC
jgi:hypothetical protein